MAGEIRAAQLERLEQKMMADRSKGPEVFYPRVGLGFVFISLGGILFILFQNPLLLLITLFGFFYITFAFIKITLLEARQVTLRERQGIGIMNKLVHANQRHVIQAEHLYLVFAAAIIILGIFAYSASVSSLNRNIVGYAYSMGNQPRVDSAALRGQEAWIAGKDFSSSMEARVFFYDGESLAESIPVNYLDQGHATISLPELPEECASNGCLLYIFVTDRASGLSSDMFSVGVPRD